jgi:transglutaminase-like putative cysteine protease
MMLLRILHETKLTYSEPVTETVFEVRMAPPSDDHQTNLGYRLRIVPGAPVTIYRDGFGNRVDLFNILAAYSELIIRATSIVRTHRGPGPESRLAGLEWDADRSRLEALESLEYLESSPLVQPSPELNAFLGGLPRPAGRLLDLINQLTASVQSHLVYEKKVTTARTPVGEALRLGRGVCQDFAHLFLAACRGIGLPARYVSGYIHQPGEVATHAWCQVLAGASGWVDVDPTRRSFVGDDYVTIAVGRDYSDVSPNRGVWKGRADETIAVAVKVEPIERVPADWSDWAATQAPWSAASWIQSQSRTRRIKLNPKAGYRQQQGQQQQGHGWRPGLRGEVSRSDSRDGVNRLP